MEAAVDKKGNKSQLRESPIRVHWRIQLYMYITPHLIYKTSRNASGMLLKELIADLEMKLAKRDELN